MPAGERFGEYLVEQRPSPGTVELGFDSRILFFEALQYPLAQIEIRRRPPNEFAFLLSTLNDFRIRPLLTKKLGSAGKQEAD